MNVTGLIAESIRYWEPRRLWYNLALTALASAWVVVAWPPFSPGLHAGVVRETLRPSGAGERLLLRRLLGRYTDAAICLRAWMASAPVGLVAAGNDLSPGAGLLLDRGRNLSICGCVGLDRGNRFDAHRGSPSWVTS